MESVSLEHLRNLSEPARLYVGDEIEYQLWHDAKFFYELWQKKRAGRKAPSRSDFTPRELKPILPHISLADIEYAPFRARGRVMGTAVVDAIGYDPTGEYADEYPNTELALQRQEWVAVNCEPLLIVGAPLVWSPKNFKTYDMLGLPLVAKDGQVDKIFYVHQYSG